ncbi:5539_t:CDS:2, partial [Gigaspora rosea]
DEDQFNDAEENRKINIQLKLMTQKLENNNIHPMASYNVRPFDQIFGQHSNRLKSSNSTRHLRDKTLEIQTSENEEEKNFENTNNSTDSYISTSLLYINTIGNAVESFFPLLKTAASFLEKIEGNIVDNTKTLSTVLQEVMIIKKQIETPNVKKFKVKTIPSNELSDPLFNITNRDTYVIKKIYKGQDVICKLAKINQDDTD